MDFLGEKFVKKEKQRVAKVPKQRKIQTRGLRLAVWGGVFVLSFSGVFAYWQTGMTLSRINHLTQQVNQVEKQLKEEGQIVSLTPEVEFFMNRFVSLYMNVTTDQEVQDEREKLLMNDYYGNGMNWMINNVNMERVLTSASFAGLEKVNGLKTARYKVSYTIKTKKGEKIVESKETQLLNIPFEGDGQGCRVVSMPYFSAVPENHYYANFLGKNTADFPVVTDGQEEIQKYVEEFLTKYAESSPSDMRYMMEKPEGLDGSMAFERLESCQIYQEEKGGYLVKVAVVFKNEMTGFQWIEQMTLHLVQKEKNYYVEQLIHNWKE